MINIFDFRSSVVGTTLVWILCFVAFAYSQPQPEIPVPLVRRVMDLRPELPAEALPQMPAMELRIVRPGLFAHWRPVFEIADPKGGRTAGTLDGGLYIREAEGGETRIVASPRENWLWDIEGAKWSPDGTKLAARMIDNSEVPRIPIIDWLGKHEKITTHAYSRAGEKLPKHQIYIVDLASGRTSPVDHGQEDPYFHILDWDLSSSRLFMLRANRLTNRLDLLAADATNGRITPVFSETNSSGAMWWHMLHGYDERIASAGLVHVLDDGRFIWTSEKSGIPQLYLYASNGSLIRPLTAKSPAGSVNRLIDVDEKRGFAYAVMQGADDSSPYDQTLYRISLGDGNLLKLADGPSILFVSFSNQMSKLWIHRSGLPDTFGVDSMNNDGTDRKAEWSPDLSFLNQYGFSPEILQSLAADGKTMIESLILKPKGFDPKRKYPVLEWIYGAPNARGFENLLPDPQILSLQPLADRGFIIVITDGRGTKDRGRDFRDHAFGKFGQVEIADHAAVLRQLAAKLPYLDLSRVGIMGHSWGGYFALRALLEEPGIYKAGVMLSPGLDASSMRVPVEPYMGCLPVDCPDKYEIANNSSRIGSLKAPVMVIHGTADDDIPVAEAIKLVDALQRSGKEHELVLLPNVDHIVQRNPVTFKKAGEFFERFIITQP